MTSTVRIAILDDYLHLASKHLAKLQLQPAPQITTFSEEVPLPIGDPLSETEIQALAKKLEPFEIISTMRERTPFPAALLRRLPNLKLLLITGRLARSFDIEVATNLGIIVATAPGQGHTDLPPDQRRNVPQRGPPSTTQHTWSLILAIARNIAQDDYNVKCKQGWQSNLAVGLPGKTLGICGLGKLGASTARIGILAWGMKVICWSSSLTQEKADQIAKELDLPVTDTEGEKTFKVIGKSELFQEADVLSIHYILSPRSKGLVGREELSLMKPNAFLINTSRGPLIDEDALYDTLSRGKIGGAALDVYNVEPIPIQDRWRSTEWGQNGKSRVVLSPHMGYVEEEGMEAWYEETAENIGRWISGKPVLHQVN